MSAENLHDRSVHAPVEIHQDDGAVHVHIASAKFYVAIFLALVCLTLLTIGVAYVPLGKMNLVVAVVIASTKAALVATFFMHLRHEAKFNVLMFIGALLFIGVFFAYTMNDTERRGELDDAQGVEVFSETGKAAPGGQPVMSHEDDEHMPRHLATGGSEVK